MTPKQELIDVLEATYDRDSKMSAADWEKRYASVRETLRRRTADDRTDILLDRLLLQRIAEFLLWSSGERERFLR